MQEICTKYYFIIAKHAYYVINCHLTVAFSAIILYLYI